MIQPGKLRHRLTLQEPTVQASETSTKGRTVFAMHRVIKAERIRVNTEDIFKDGTRPKSVVKFRIRYVKGLTTTWRFVYNGETYNITNLDEPVYNREQIITAIKH